MTRRTSIDLRALPDQLPLSFGQLEYLSGDSEGYEGVEALPGVLRASGGRLRLKVEGLRSEQGGGALTGWAGAETLENPGDPASLARAIHRLARQDKERRVTKDTPPEHYITRIVVEPVRRRRKETRRKYVRLKSGKIQARYYSRLSGKQISKQRWQVDAG